MTTPTKVNNPYTVIYNRIKEGAYTTSLPFPMFVPSTDPKHAEYLADFRAYMAEMNDMVDNKFRVDLEQAYGFKGRAKSERQVGAPLGTGGTLPRRNGTPSSWAAVLV